MEERMNLLQQVADICTELLKQSSMNTDNMVVADTYVYLSAVFAGISCAVAAKSEEVQQALAKPDNEGPALFTVGSDCGSFLFGSVPNALLFGTPFSPFQAVMSLCKNTGKPIPDITGMAAQLSSNLGDPTLRIWNGQRNPYEEVKDASHAFLSLIENLGKTTPLALPELQIVFSITLNKVLSECHAHFPAEVDLPTMVTEAFLTFGHFNL